jgi:hypothetical protein
MALPLAAAFPTLPVVQAGSLTKVYSKAGAAPTVAELLPVTSEIGISMDGQSETISLYDTTGSSFTVKTGYGYTLTFETIASPKDTNVAALVAAAHSIGTAALMWITVEMPDVGYLTGIFAIEKADPKTPVRGAYRTMFTAKSSGKVLYTPAP